MGANILLLSHENNWKADIVFVQSDLLPHRHDPALALSTGILPLKAIWPKRGLSATVSVIPTVSNVYHYLLGPIVSSWALRTSAWGAVQRLSLRATVIFRRRIILHETPNRRLSGQTGADKNTYHVREKRLM
jgi:hypothetical protein